MRQPNIWCERAFCVERYAGLQSTQRHAHTPNVMLPHHHIEYLHF